MFPNERHPSDHFSIGYEVQLNLNTSSEMAKKLLKLKEGMLKINVVEANITESTCGLLNMSPYV